MTVRCALGKGASGATGRAGVNPSRQARGRSTPFAWRSTRPHVVLKKAIARSLQPAPFFARIRDPPITRRKESNRGLTNHPCHCSSFAGGGLVSPTAGLEIPRSGCRLRGNPGRRCAGFLVRGALWVSVGPSRPDSLIAVRRGLCRCGGSCYGRPTRAARRTILAMGLLFSRHRVAWAV